MFDKLRNAFSGVAKSFGEKELKEKDIDEILFDLEISLLESDVATEVIDSIKSDLKEKLIGTSVDKNEIEKFIRDSLIEIISKLFDDAGKIDILSNIDSKKATKQPYIILFVGINGTGKTTTLAKLAYMLKNAKYSIVVAAADTFRAGAIEQLKEHMNKLNLKLVAQNYGSDPAAVARDAVLYAKSHDTDCVLIDTAGRMQTSTNLMDQIEKITKVVNPDMKIFVGDSLAGNDTVNQAREFFEHVKFNGSILTKSDADARGGAALSIVKITSTPILFMGVGQEYPDLKPFDKESFLNAVFGSVAESQFSKTITDSPDSQLSTSQSETQVLDTSTEVQSTPEQINHEIEGKIPEHEEPAKVPEPPNPAPKHETELTASGVSTDDPFFGINDKDINKYADLFDVPPPENDKQAADLANKIKEWVLDGRPKPGDETTKFEELNGEEKTKKKGSRFGFLRK